MDKLEHLDHFTLSWPEGVFPLGQDALALGRFATVRSGWRVCDLGTGSGLLLLLLAGCDAAKLTGAKQEEKISRSSPQRISGMRSLSLMK